VAPTPAVAFVAAADGVAGAVISASHNPFADNGVKLFTAGGRKLSDGQEAALEAELHALLGHAAPGEARTGDAVGAVSEARADVGRWSDSVVASIEGRRLEGVHMVVDCANGAASGVASAALRSLGATVEVLHDEPDGTNINAGCGSTHPDDLQREVVDWGARLGVILDGGADRVVAVDAAGRLIDGDQIIAMAAIDRRSRGLLAHDTVVVTVMTNLGFRLGMAEHGIEVLEVPVGDRHVLEALADRGLSLGGEQSGHVIHADLATTGDGLLTAVQLLDVMVRTGTPLGALADAAMVRLPQVMHNVRVADKGMDVTGVLASEIAEEEAALGDQGRVLVRGSGTEPVVRVMVEATTLEAAEAAAGRLAARVASLG
jgi:phosphoglucosamine mutase